MTPVRVVFDCVVSLQAAVRETGPAGACLLLAEAGDVELFLSRHITAELDAVLSRPAFRAKFPHLTGNDAIEFQNRLMRIARFVDPVPPAITLARDPKDSPYLDLSIAVKAHFLVTRDHDLLSIAAGPDPVSVNIRALCPELLIVDPVQFFQLVRGRNQPGAPV